MKNPSILLLALLISLLFFSCSRKEAMPVTATPADSSVTSNVTAAIPEFTGPADLPPCPGLLSLESSQGDSQAGSAILLSSQTVNSLLDSYTTDLLAGGWIMESSLLQGREHRLQFRQGGRVLGLQIGPPDTPDGNSRIQLAWKPTAGTEEVREAYEPDPAEEPSNIAEESP